MSRVVLSEITVPPVPEPPGTGTVALIFANGTLYAWVGGENEPVPITQGGAGGVYTAQFKRSEQDLAFSLPCPVALSSELVATAVYVADPVFDAEITFTLTITNPPNASEIVYLPVYSAGESGVKVGSYVGKRPDAPVGSYLEVGFITDPPNAEVVFNASVVLTLQQATLQPPQ